METRVAETMDGVETHQVVARPVRPPLGQHGHHTLTPRPEPLLGQLRAAHEICGEREGQGAITCMGIANV